MRKGQGNKRKKKGHSGVTNAPEGNLYPPKTPTGVPHAGKQGKQGRESQIEIITMPPNLGKELRVSPLRERKGEQRAQEECVAARICELGVSKTQSQLKNQRPAWAT